jgi:hypothetical protein
MLLSSSYNRWSSQISQSRHTTTSGNNKHYFCHASTFLMNNYTGIQFVQRHEHNEAMKTFQVALDLLRSDTLNALTLVLNSHDDDASEHTSTNHRLTDPQRDDDPNYGCHDISSLPPEQDNMYNLGFKLLLCWYVVA